MQLIQNYENLYTAQIKSTYEPIIYIKNKQAKINSFYISFTTGTFKKPRKITKS